MTEKNIPVYKAIKPPIGSAYPSDRGHGWVQVDKLIGADENYGIVKNGIYKVISYDQGGVGIETPKQPFGNKTREMIPEQYHWVSTQQHLLLSPEDEELKVGDRVMLKERYMQYECGSVLKVKNIRPDGNETLVQLVCPKDSFWIYSHRIEKF